ncbi:active breakpoint cluster region-related protein-like [Salvelinus sp. IW2-2015]|uniref:active breakpoint cluster region-related protein-like n=1 Tax=Salvelinus sp. IW2-2015 TaxID=2691554 RepID=UPI0038D4AA4C
MDPTNLRLNTPFEALLYKLLDRITKTTLVLHDLLKHTPRRMVTTRAAGGSETVPELPVWGQRGSQCKQEVTLSRGMRRQLMRDGFVVDVCEGGVTFAISSCTLTCCCAPNSRAGPKVSRPSTGSVGTCL